MFNIEIRGVNHKLRKCSTVNLNYASVSNDAGAEYTAFGGGHGENPPAAGDPSGLTLGIIHKF